MPLFCTTHYQTLKSIQVTGNWMVVLWLSKCICYFVSRASLDLWKSCASMKYLPKNPTSHLQKGSIYKDPLCQNVLTINTKGLKCHQSCILSKITYGRKTLEDLMLWPRQYIIPKIQDLCLLVRYTLIY